MRILFFCTVVYCGLIIFSQFADAQDFKGLQDQQSAVITEAWTVKPFTRVNGTVTGECIMNAKFSNGFEVGFKGKNNQLTAIRLKQYQNSRTQDLGGFVKIGLNGNWYGLQSRAQGRQIDASLLTVPAAAQTMANQNVFGVRIGATDYFFATAGFEAGFQELLRCQGENSLTTLQVVDSTRGTYPKDLEAIQQQNAVPAQKPVPKAFKLADQTPRAPALAPVEDVMADDLPPLLPIDPEPFVPEEKAPEETVEVNESRKTALQYNMDREGKWTAQKGDRLVNVLTRWGKTAGVKTDINLQGNPVLKRDFAATGSFEVAVNQLLKDVSAGEVVKPSAVLKGSDGKSTHVSGYQGDMMVAAEQGEPVPDRWRALEGTSLRKVLQRWSAEEGVDFVWKSNQEFYVPQSIKSTEEYSKAVALLLSQFEGQPVRPTAVLNNDPDTGGTALIIKSKKNAS